MLLFEISPKPLQKQCFQRSTLDKNKLANQKTLVLKGGRDLERQRKEKWKKERLTKKTGKREDERLKGKKREEEEEEEDDDDDDDGDED